MSTLEGKRILIVEDEFLVALTASEMLGELGAVVVGPAGTLKEALELARTQDIDLALLDLNLYGQSSMAVADTLDLRRIPVVFATGYERGGSKDAGRLVLGKPYTQEKLAMQLCRALDGRAGRERRDTGAGIS
nr:response regulator [uncultured Steroidobacter sp.]